MTKKKEPYSKEVQETLDRIMRVSSREKEPTEPWNPPKYQCPKCNTIIWSRYPGQFCSCACGKCFVDQTRYYSRIGGSPNWLGEDDE